MSHYCCLTGTYCSLLHCTVKFLRMNLVKSYSFPFYEKRMRQIVPGDNIGDEWKGYQLRINGGNDKQGFPMKQGVLTNGRVRLLLSKGHTCYRPRKKGERKRKSVRGCIVDSNLSVIAMSIVKVTIIGILVKFNRIATSVNRCIS